MPFFVEKACCSGQIAEALGAVKNAARDELLFMHGGSHLSFVLESLPIVILLQTSLSFADQGARQQCSGNPLP